MTKDRREEEKADLGWELKEGAAAPGREDQRTGREREVARPGSPRPEPSLPLPQRPVLGPAQNMGAGRACAMTCCANRQRSGDCWNQLEPVRTGGVRREANVSQREAAAHSSRIPAPGWRGWVLVLRPSPSLCPLPGPRNTAYLFSRRGAGSPRAPGTYPPRFGRSPVSPSLCS